MRKHLILALSILPFSGWGTDIFKCEDTSGNIVFSGLPCVAEDNTQEQLNKSIPTTKTFSDTKKTTENKRGEVRPLSSYTSESVKQYLEALKIDKFSQVLAGIYKDSFHGISVTELSEARNIDLEKWFLSDESLGYMVTASNDFYMFSVTKTVYNGEENSHHFLDLTDRDVINILKRRGFGAPKDRHGEGDYLWKWNNSGLKCKFSYRRNRFNPQKGFQYTCQNI